MKKIIIPNRKTPSELEKMIFQADAAFDKQLKNLCQTLSKLPKLHVLGLTGPTCSGKTTAANLFTSYMESLGRHVQVISLDDFFFEKEYLEKLAFSKGSETLDYDSVETIDLELLKTCVDALNNDVTTRLPRYNFRTGEREMGDWMDPEPEDLFLFEGIQVLYPKVNQILSKPGYRSIFIAPQSAIEINGISFEPNEIRLMRRLVRDYLYRNATPEFTLSLWKSVRENEENSIFPFTQECTESIDSTMDYEIGILKPFLVKMFEESPVGEKNQATVQSLLQKIKDVQEIPANLISKNSLYKEFIL